MGGCVHMTTHAAVSVPQTEQVPLASLGRAGLMVPRFGLGAAPLGGLYTSVGEQQAHDALEAAWAAGVRYFDTAPHYGAGLSERRTGAFLAGKPTADWVLSTKVGRQLAPSGGPQATMFAGEPPTRRSFDFSRDGILRSLADSLERLGTDRVDVLLLHDPDQHWRQAIDEGWPVLAELRDQGVVRSIGAGMNQTAMLTRFVRETDMDVVLLAGRYTLLDQSALDDLLPACVERSTSVVVGGAFNSGVLADPRPGSMFDYRPASPQVLARARRAQEVCARYDVPLAAAAVQLPGAHPAVATVLLGTRDAHEAKENARLGQLPIDPGLWQDLKSEGLLREDTPVPTAGTEDNAGVPCT